MLYTVDISQGSLAVMQGRTGGVTLVSDKVPVLVRNTSNGLDPSGGELSGHLVVFPYWTHPVSNRYPPSRLSRGR